MQQAMQQSPRSTFHGILKQALGEMDYWKVTKLFNDFSDTQLPPRLYRYRQCKERTFQQLEDSQLAFSRGSTFVDDLTDMQISTSGESLTKVAALLSSNPKLANDLLAIISQLAPESCPRNERPSIGLYKLLGIMPWDLFADPKTNAPVIALTGHADEQINCAKNGLEQIVSHADLNLLRNTTYVACLCENPNSDYMWKNYAGNGTGFMITYETEDLRSIGKSANRHSLIAPAVYTDEMPDLSPYVILNTMLNAGFIKIGTNTPIDALGLASTAAAIYCKHTKFKREEEWRLTLRGVTNDESECEYLSRICPCIAVTPGPNISSENLNELERIVEKLPKAKLSKYGSQVA